MLPVSCYIPFINELICLFVFYSLYLEAKLSANVELAIVHSKLIKIKLDYVVCGAVRNYFTLNEGRKKIIFKDEKFPS